MSQIAGEYVATKEITKIVKLALVERWGRENVSVRKGRGTASHWVEASIEIPHAHDCHCQPMQFYCDRCRFAQIEAAAEARKRVEIAMEHHETKFSQYSSDDGFGDDRDCFILQVSIKR